jgi:acetyl esterase/lipase
MNKSIIYLFLSFSIFFSSCSVKLASVPNKSAEQLAANYKVLKNISYGSDKEEDLDIYISKDAKKLSNKNFTVIFLHGGGYYLSDKSKEEKYIQPYLDKGMNVVNLNYRLKRGIPIATKDLTNALHFLKANNGTYQLNLNRIILTGFSAGAHIASYVGISANNPIYKNKLDEGIKISGIINFSGPVDGLDVVEKVFMDNEMPLMKDLGNALFPSSEGYAPKALISKYAPITYLDKNDPPFFLWQGGKDDQVPPITFEKFVAHLNENRKKNEVIFIPEGLHSPNATELKNAYDSIFVFLDRL